MTTATRTYIRVTVLRRDGRYETVLVTTSRAKARAEAERQKLLGWSGRVETEATQKVLAEF